MVLKAALRVWSRTVLMSVLAMLSLGSTSLPSAAFFSRALSSPLDADATASGVGEAW